MPSRDPSLPVIQLLAVLLGLPALAGFLLGVVLVVPDLLGLLVVALAGLPLLLAVAAAGSETPVVVRTCGLALGVVALVYARWVGLGGSLLLLPGLLVVVATGSLVTSYGRPERRDGPIRSEGRP